MANDAKIDLGTVEQAEAWAIGEYDRWQAAFLALKDSPTAGEWVVACQEIASANVERVEKELARVTKLCKKYGQGAPVVQFSPTQYPVRRRRAVRNEDGETAEIQRTILCRQMVTVSPEVVGQEGWRIVAKVTHLDGQNAVIAPFPGETVPDFAQFRRPECEHCHTVRRRNETFIVTRKLAENDHGRWDKFQQVGTTCLQEFMGIDPGYALALAGWYEATGEVNDTDRYEEPIEDWLSWVAVAVRLDGRYWSKGAADDYNDRNGAYDGYSSINGGRRQETTVQHAHLLMNSAAWDRKAAEAAGEVPNEVDRATVEAVRAWVLTLDPSMGQYHANLLAIFRAGILVQGTHGLAASAFSGYLRERREVERAQQQAAMPPSVWVGNQGDKVDLGVVKVASVKEIDGQYGVTFLYKFVTGSGNHLTWFSSNDMGLSAGDTCGIKGTVKKLDEYQGVKQTVLTRCKVAR